MTPGLPPTNDHDLFIWLAIFFICGAVGNEDSGRNHILAGFMGVIAGLVVFDVVDGYLVEYEGIMSAVLIGSALSSASILARVKVVINSIVKGFSLRVNGG